MKLSTSCLRVDSGFKTRICPPYRHACVKATEIKRFLGITVKRLAPCRCLEGHVKELYQMSTSMASEPEVQLLLESASTPMCGHMNTVTVISLIVTLNNQVAHSLGLHLGAVSYRATSSGTKVRTIVTLDLAEQRRCRLKFRHLNFNPYPCRTRAGPRVTLVATHATMRMSLFWNDGNDWEFQMKVCSDELVQ